MLRLLMLFALLPLPSGQALQEDLESRLKRKLESPFLKKAPWIVDFDRARDEAKKGDRRILTYFTRSDTPLPAAAPFEDKLFIDPAFVEWAGPFVLHCHVTTGIKDRKHEKLPVGRPIPGAELMDADGRIVARLEGAPTLGALQVMVGRADALAELRKKGDDKSARALVFAAEAELGNYPLDDAKKRAAELADLPAEVKARVDRALVHLEVSDILGRVDGTDPTQRAEAGRKFLEMKKAGRIPESADLVQGFWMQVMEVAELQKDAAGFEEALTALQARFGDVPGAREFLEQKAETLRVMKGLK